MANQEKALVKEVDTNKGELNDTSTHFKYNW